MTRTKEDGREIHGLANLARIVITVDPTSNVQNMIEQVNKGRTDDHKNNSQPTTNSKPPKVEHKTKHKEKVELTTNIQAMAKHTTKH